MNSADRSRRASRAALAFDAAAKAEVAHLAAIRALDELGEAEAGHDMGALDSEALAAARARFDAAAAHAFEAAKLATRAARGEADAVCTPARLALAVEATRDLRAAAGDTESAAALVFALGDRPELANARGRDVEAWRLTELAREVLRRPGAR